MFMLQRVGPRLGLADMKRMPLVVESVETLKTLSDGPHVGLRLNR